MTWWGWKGLTCGLSQQPAEAGGSPSPGTRVRVGAAPTTTGRVGTARRLGSGKRDGKVYECRNQWLNPLKSRTGSNLADMGRDAVRDLPRGCGSTPEPVLADGEEAALKACGVGAVMLPGYSWAPAWPNDAQ